MSSSVEIGRAPTTVTFRSASRERSDDPYASGSLVVELRSEGLELVQSVFMISFDWDALGSLFSDMAESWRGWDGEKEWSSLESHLRISATSDHLGHCILNFTVQDHPEFTWRTIVHGLVLDAGEEMAALAEEIRLFIAAA